VASLGRAEPLHGTASTVRAFLLVEDSGPWGTDAVQDCRSLSDVSAELLRRAHATRVRVLLIRRHGRYTPTGIRVFAAYADAHHPWLETTVLDEPGQLLDLDLAGLTTGESIGLPLHSEPLFCVCTHGRHDVCCAEQGRPVAAALSASHPDQTWEVSHIGGDRFAGNVLVLPEGLYYGRVSPEAASALAQRHEAGRVDLDRLRGRSAYPFLMQAADAMLRRHLGVEEVYGVQPVGSQRLFVDGAARVFAVDLAVDTRSPRRPATATPEHPGHELWRVTLRTEPGPPTQLTCRARRDDAPPTYTLLDIEQLVTDHG
jgi:hypothetical protein